MRGDALKSLAAIALTGAEPSDEDARNALADAIDILLSLGSLGERMTVALERIASPMVQATAYTQVQVEPLKGDGYGSWTVEAIGNEGEIEQTVFAGPDAEVRARNFTNRVYGGEKGGDQTGS